LVALVCEGRLGYDDTGARKCYAISADESRHGGEMNLDDLLKEMVKQEASDLYLKAYSPCYLRVDDQLVPLSGTDLSPKDVEQISDSLMDEDQKATYRKQWEMDLAFRRPGIGRFRVNIYWQQGTRALVFRSIREHIQTFEELNLPVDVLQKLSFEPRGMVLITGIAGSGKSTTLASMIEYVNQREAKHIITVEDPVEFVFTDKKSVISQREVGMDTLDFHAALRHVIRQSPDIILIGEMRDLETMSSAIMAAETGHLVLSTLHTVDSSQTVERIINYFPPYQHPQIRMQLSLVLKGVMSMRLLVKKDGSGRIPACEIMLSTPTVRKIIHEGRTGDLYDAIKKGGVFGMQTFNQALIKLLKANKITEEEARRYADNVEELELEMRGIYLGSAAHDNL
jgi:twitching motility protein PilT